MDFQNKVALITGGASGIGEAITRALASHHASVVINYHHSEAKAKTLVHDIVSKGGNAIAVQADISQFDEAKKLVDEAVKAFGGLDIVVNNAGITDDALILRMSEAQFDHVIDTDLKGVWHVCKHAARLLLKSTQGRLINITSVAGMTGNVGQSNYSAAKAGVIGLTKTLAREFASRHVTVNAIAPGFIASNMTEKLPSDIVDSFMHMIPLKRFGKPEEIAHAVLFLASEEASYITGQVLSVNGGMVI